MTDLDGRTPELVHGEAMDAADAAAVAALCSTSSTVPRVRVLSFLAHSSESTRKDIAESIGEPPESMGYSIKVLVAAGLVEETRTEPGSTFVERFYRLTEYGEAFYEALRVLARIARHPDGPGPGASPPVDRPTVGGGGRVLISQGHSL